LKQKVRLGGKDPFSMNLLPGSVLNKRKIEEADIINLHFAGGSPFSLKKLVKWGKPIVWTLHDMWAFTSGEHYRPGEDLGNYDGGARRVERYFFRRKASVYRRLNLSIVCPSQWLSDCACRSILLGGAPISVIPYSIDLDRYRTIPREQARTILGLPQNRPLLLFGADRGAATGARKGFDLLREALHRLHSEGFDLDLVLFGSRDYPSGEMPPFRVHLPGMLKDDVSLALLYSAADVFVAPSRQDNLPNTVIESLSCGTPVVAFRVGGMPDMITGSRCGMLASPFDTNELASGIQSFLRNTAKAEVRHACRDRACALFEPGKIASSYQGIYDKLVKNGK